MTAYRLAACMTLGLALPMSQPTAAQNLTSFVPDVVMECRSSVDGKPSDQCSYTCFTIPRPADNAISTWPPIRWKFARLEFFSKQGRESENWLVAIKGRSDSIAITANTTFFITLGHSFLCVYDGNEPGKPNSVEVKLVKYY